MGNTWTKEGRDVSVENAELDGQDRLTARAAIENAQMMSPDMYGIGGSF